MLHVTRQNEISWSSAISGSTKSPSRFTAVQPCTNGRTHRAGSDGRRSQARAPETRSIALTAFLARLHLSRDFSPLLKRYEHPIRRCCECPERLLIGGTVVGCYRLLNALELRHRGA